ncbi:MAG: hypothetical protein GXP10_01925, partial [Gammaproteobacteria bacterium]|nr:hypothetical protein [Gammaproteobacteria bacterium]
MFTKRNAAMGLMFSALTVIAPLSHGESVDQRWYVAPSLSYIGADNDRIADDGPGFQLGLGKAINEQWNLEISAVAD